MKLMVGDADLAEHGDLLTFDADKGITHWFGTSAKLVAGSILIEHGSSLYYVQWQSVDKTYGFVEEHPADAMVRTEDDIIYLWRIEDGDAD